MKNNQTKDLEDFILNLVIVVAFIAIASMSLVYLI
ncbi:hypothetical protein SAMN05444363_1936 [Flavobacterium terrae]|uniref:Uncharacterized protein n=1 Tax=Flavobacterium terrae TaxID=415425 RepID=A0A1M6ESW3_9FLAO|nr:hypothetical protein SAMN05444363_1936 [Flavobacterium terrae]